MGDFTNGDMVRSRLVPGMIGKVKTVMTDGHMIVNVDGTDILVVQSNWVKA